MSNSGGDSNGGGILRSTKQKNNPVGGRGVTFSARDNNDDDDDVPPSRRLAPSSHNTSAGDEYDSDEVQDAIMASGDGLSMMNRHHRRSGDTEPDNMDNDDDPVLSTLEIEEAKRKRGRVRRNEDVVLGASSGNGDGITDDDEHTIDNNHPSLSLITDHGANPDTYESNAGGNASCPVEPFNMNAEQEGGMGYFDGDTYVFRQNTKPVDGEEDAWLDGFKADDDDENEEEARGGGGLDSTAVWNPSNSDTKKSSTNNNTKQKEKFKYIDENATPEDIGRRLATLLQSDNETIMKALTRHGSQLREMQSKEQKLKKSKLLRKRKSKSKETADNDSTNADGGEMKSMSSLQIDETRKVVEELTELADALLFGGEVEAYDLTKADWIHRFKLESHFPSLSTRKRPTDNDTDKSPEAKKQRRGYFDDDANNDAAAANGESTTQSEPVQPHGNDQVMWEYRGNEDGAIHGPYTSKQMMEWTSCGYFVGDSAVDIRRVGSMSSEVGKVKTVEEDAPTKTDVDDLMADLESDGEDNGDEGDRESASVNAESSWMRSDRVDFSLYL